MSELSGNKQKLVAIVFCFDQNNYRRIEWGKLLSSMFDSVWLVSGKGKWRLFNSKSKKEGNNVSSKERPKEADAIFVHTGDLVSLNELLDTIQYKNRFDFNQPGTPKAETGILSIFRGTNPFDLDKSDAKEIADYVAGLRTEKPECCTRKDVLQYLPALAILCQGYLVIHINPETGEPENIGKEDNSARKLCKDAQELMGYNKLVNDEAKVPLFIKDQDRRGDLQKKVCQPDWWQIFDTDDYIKKAYKEWGDDLQEWPKAETLFQEIMNDSDIKPGVVADAYLAITKNLKTMQRQQ